MADLISSLSYWQRLGLEMAGVIPDHFADAGNMGDTEAEAILRRIKGAAPAHQRDLFSLD